MKFLLKIKIKLNFKAEEIKTDEVKVISTKKDKVSTEWIKI